MKIKLKCGRVGVTPDGVAWSQDPGDEVDVPADEAQRLIKAGQAAPAKDEPPARK